VPRLTLTFDNGPTPGATEHVLNVLKQRGLRTTFFVIGQNLRDAAGKKLAERAKAEGHWLGNHTLTHSEPLGLHREAVYTEREIGETQELLGDLAHPDRFFRPIGQGQIGHHLLSRAAVDYLATHEYTLVTWNNVPRDWVEPRAQWVGRALETMAQQDWALLVLHDFAIAGMLGTLTDFLDRMQNNGVDIVQEMPPSCVPMLRGEIRAPLEDLVTEDG
jgi:peptidoglycan/xylan/chitin deacetylase (PgdA/CDA1 family)